MNAQEKSLSEKLLPYFDPKAGCPVCHEALVGTVEVCPRCGVGSHKGCYDFTGSCGTIYCSDRGATGKGHDGSETLPKGTQGVAQSLEEAVGIRDQIAEMEHVLQRVRGYNVRPATRRELRERIRTWLDGGLIFDEATMLSDVISRYGVDNPHYKERLQRLAFIAADASHKGVGGYGWSDKFLFYALRELNVQAGVDQLTIARLLKAGVNLPKMREGVLAPQTAQEFYAGVVKDLLCAKQFPDALTIAEESGIASLVKQTTFGVGMFYVGERWFEMARAYFVRGEHYEKAIEADLKRPDVDDETLFDIIFQKYIAAQPEPRDIAAARFSRQVARMIQDASLMKHPFVKQKDRRFVVPGLLGFSGQKVYGGLLGMSVRYELYLKDLFDYVSGECYRIAQERLEREGDLQKQLDLADEFKDDARKEKIMTTLQSYQALESHFENGGS